MKRRTASMKYTEFRVKFYDAIYNCFIDSNGNTGVLDFEGTHFMDQCESRDEEHRIGALFDREIDKKVKKLIKKGK